MGTTLLINCFDAEYYLAGQKKQPDGINKDGMEGKHQKMIDNPEKTKALMEKIKDHLPIQFYTTKRYSISVRNEHKIKVRPNKKLMVSDVIYMGDVGGITCAVEQKDVAIFTSITSLRISQKHPLGPEIREYQAERIKKLAFQNK